MIRLAEEGRRQTLKKPLNRLFFLLVLGFLFLCFAGAAAAGERVAVAVKEANVRSGPGTDHPVLWKLDRYYPLEVQKRKDGWARVRDFEGDEGWIYDKLIKKMATLVVSVQRAIIRSGPGKNYGIVAQADRGVPFRILGKKGNWIQVSHSKGYEGWIYKTLVWQ